MSVKNRDWIIAVSYVVLIYATLEIAPIPLAFLRAHNLLRLTIGIFFFVAAIVVLRMLLGQRPLLWWKLPLLIIIALAYFYGSKHVKTPEEQVHFFEYGLVGCLFLRALAHDQGFSPKAGGIAWFLASTAGWIDELLQGLSPHRHYDIKDVFLDAFSAGLGLAVYFLCQKPKSTR